jgi:hypothetical protein
LLAGNHRYEVFKRLGIEKCWMHVFEPGSVDREAIELNMASEDALPMSFVDYAELVWRKLNGGGVTQQQVAQEFGWSRGAVSNYAALRGVDSNAWKVVATALGEVSVPREEGAVARNATPVAFTENLLRSILPLTAAQQLELVRSLARGKNGKGHKYGKAELKEEAERYQACNAVIRATPLICRLRRARCSPHDAQEAAGERVL